MKNQKSISYTVPEIMVILNISRTHAYEFVNNNPPFRVLHAGRCVRVPKDSFDKWFFGDQGNKEVAQPQPKQA